MSDAIHYLTVKLNEHATEIKAKDAEIASLTKRLDDDSEMKRITEALGLTDLAEMPERLRAAEAEIGRLRAELDGVGVQEFMRLRSLAAHRYSEIASRDKEITALRAALETK